MAHFGGEVGADVARGRDPTSLDALLDDLIQESATGGRLAPVWRRHARAFRSADVTFVAQAWSLSETLGAPLADSVTLAAASVRQHVSRRQRVAIAVAGPRATATVLSGLPLAGPVVGLLLGLSPRELYGTPVGAVSTSLGVILLLVGRWWCRRMVAGLARPRGLAGGPA
ncbi:MAG: hypothetical protein ABI083_02855 [Lapillicoccus sp.]